MDEPTPENLQQGPEVPPPIPWLGWAILGLTAAGLAAYAVRKPPQDEPEEDVDEGSGEEEPDEDELEEDDEEEEPDEDDEEEPEEEDETPEAEPA